MTIIMVSFGVFGQSDFVKTLVSNSPVLALFVISTFGAGGFDGFDMS